jgi:hypothetical protein
MQALQERRTAMEAAAAATWTASWCAPALLSPDEHTGALQRRAPDPRAPLCSGHAEGRSGC